MSKAQYDIYVGKVLDLAKTLVVKSKATAEAINSGLIALGIPVLESDPSTWKYYLNLSGQYHSTDVLMTVTSLDTLQTIVFTREVLLNHQTTAREYVYGSRYYNELLERYPDQEIIIRGVLHPVDINVAIAADDGEVLYYDQSLVEENETNLIPGLSQWSRSFMVRWHNAAYTITDDLYAAAQLAVLYMNIPLVILNIRLGNCHTPYAHSFHIREYLASNGRLDQYADSLNKKQLLWLYRNIRYLQRNAGKQETFALLMQNLLTDRGLPLAEWTMRHNLADQLDEIYPDIEFFRTPLNFGYNVGGEDTRTIAEMLVAERPAAKSNIRVEPEAEPAITVQMENSLNDRLSTKVLESSVLDLTDASPFPLSDCLLSHWLYFAVTDRYNAVILVDNPQTGDALTLSMRDAFIIFLYCFNVAYGFRPGVVPTIQAHNVRRDPMPTKAELRGIVSPALVSEELIDAAYIGLEPVEEHISIGSFYAAASKIHKGQLYHRSLYTRQEHYVARGQVQQMTGRFYQTYTCNLADEQTYAEWFSDRSLSIPTLSNLEAGQLADAILVTATGANLKAAESLREIQASMLRLMTQLSSYSVQYLQSINTQPIKVVEWPAIRVGDIDMKGGERAVTEMPSIRVEDVDASGHVHLNVPLAGMGDSYTIDARSYHREKMDLGLRYRANARITFKVQGMFPRIGVRRIYETISQMPVNTPDLDTDEYIPRDRLLLIGAFASLTSPSYVLTANNRQTLLDRWTTWVDSQPPIPADLPANMVGDGLNYPPIPGNPLLPGADLPVLAPPELGVYLDGLTAPEPQKNLYLGGLTAPVAQKNLYLEGLSVPAQQKNLYLNGLNPNPPEG